MTTRRNWLRRLELRRWRSGQAIYCGRRVTVVSTRGVEANRRRPSQAPRRSASLASASSIRS
jgi:hypothetical protein